MTRLWRHRWTALLAVAAALVLGCDLRLPGSSGDGSGEGAQPARSEEAVPTRQGPTRMPQVDLTQSDGPRGRWEMRLWIGLWCEWGPTGGPPPPADPFLVLVDGVEMLRVPPECEPTTDDGPNLATIAFTLGEGRHALTFVGPDGARDLTALNIDDDTWVRIDYGWDEDAEALRPDVRVGTRHLSWDAVYDPSTRPGAAVPRGTGSEPPSAPAAGADQAPADGWIGADDGVVLGSAPVTDQGPAPEGRPRRERDPAGNWIVGTAGYLRVESAVPARVWIDGHDTGQRTPTGAIPLSGGGHRVELRGDGTLRRAFSVDITPGRLRTLVNDQVQ